MASAPTPTQVATAIIKRAEEYGVMLDPKHDLLTVSTSFAAGDTDAYLKAERDCRHVLSMIRMVRPGSQWGTDSASVGGHAGMTGGYCRLSKSGVDKRVLNALRKQLS